MFQLVKSGLIWKQLGIVGFYKQNALKSGVKWMYAGFQRIHGDQFQLDYTFLGFSGMYMTTPVRSSQPSRTYILRFQRHKSDIYWLNSEYVANPGQILGYKGAFRSAQCRRNRCLEFEQRRAHREECDFSY
jgi:hypothetical protein